MAKLISLKLTEETETHYLFTIKVKRKWLFFIESVTIFDCARVKGNSQSFFVSSGESIFRTFLYMDESISAILATKNKCYLKEER